MHDLGDEKDVAGDETSRAARWDEVEGGRLLT